jgi:hypothetical protein
LPEALELRVEAGFGGHEGRLCWISSRDEWLRLMSNEDIAYVIESGNDTNMTEVRKDEEALII